MPRLFSRVGPWLFLAALIWYLAGNFLIDSLHKKNLAQAKSLHKNEQHFDVNAATGVVIRSMGDNVNLGNVNVIFDSNVSQAIINNENLWVSANGQLVDGMLNITLSNLKTRRYESFVPLTIRLPLSVNKVTFAGVSASELSGHLPKPIDELNLEILDCKSTVKMNHFEVNRLTLTATCKPLPEKRCCHAGFDISDGVVISKLDVTMSRGKLDFSADVIPKQIQLNLSEAVEITGRRAFLQAARFGKQP